MPVTDVLYDRGGAVFNVKAYGAAGDGVTNDTAAFQLCAAAVTAAGGGTLVIPPATYIVGQQTFAGATGLGYAYLNATILDFANMAGPIEILGYGAKLRFANGLKYGSFNPTTGMATGVQTSNDYRAIVGVMLQFNNCGRVAVRGLELDGNQDGYVLGGPFGDTGIQISATGIHALTCESVHVEDIYAHDFGLDGFTFAHPNYDPAAAGTKHTPVTMDRCRSWTNGRQGVSRVGGRGLCCHVCDFSFNGTGRIQSAPSAGLDVEQEGTSWVMDTVLEGCTVLDNAGPGVLFATGPNVRGLTIRRSILWGTRNYAVWAKQPDLTIEDSQILGSSLFQYLPATPGDAYRFLRSTFDDKPHATLGVFRGYEVLNADNCRGLVMEGCTIRGRGILICYIESDSTEDMVSVIRNTRFVQANPALPAGAECGTIYQASLEYVKFISEAGVTPGTPWVISAGGTTSIFNRGCYASAEVRWASVANPAGVIATAPF